MAPSADRDKALDTALAQIDRQFGKGSVMRLGDDVRAPIETIPTGSIALDIALGIGGLPRGRVVEIYGPESSGKSYRRHLHVDRRRLERSRSFCPGRPSDVEHLPRDPDVRDQGIRMVNEHGDLEALAALTHNNRKPVLRITVRSVDWCVGHPQPPFARHVRAWVHRLAQGWRPAGW